MWDYSASKSRCGPLHLSIVLGLTYSSLYQIVLIRFSSTEENGEARSLSSKPVRVGPGYIAQFDMVMGCGAPFDVGIDNAVYFQYSTDHGVTWNNVRILLLCNLSLNDFKRFFL